MTARLLLAVLLCVASGGAAQEAPVAPQAECDTCKARHRGLQSLQAARAGTKSDAANTPPAMLPTGTKPCQAPERDVRHPLAIVNPCPHPHR